MRASTNNIEDPILDGLVDKVEADVSVFDAGVEFVSTVMPNVTHCLSLIDVRKNIHP